jgi:hypothetical protein
LVAPALVSWFIWMQRASGAGLLKDTDTMVLLRRIREVRDPLYWFSHDWPLENHFYRPISTLTFELDNHWYGNNAAGYGATNALLVIATVFALFWLIRELSNRPWMAALGSFTFGLWHLFNAADVLRAPLFALAVIGVIIGIATRRAGGFALACVATLATQWAGPAFPLYGAMVAWLPGRTASTMAIFALVSLAAYARYERLTAPRIPRPPSPLSLTVTRGTAGEVIHPRRRQLGWLLLAYAGLALALGSYEQAIMVPALLLGLAIWFNIGDARRPHWGIHAGFWVVLGGYYALRLAVLPTTVSRYQDQQFRTGPGVTLSILDYAAPFYAPFNGLWASLQSGIEILVMPEPWRALLMGLGLLGCFWALRTSRDRWLIAFAWLAAMFAFLPMAWLKHFAHYHHFPAALQALAFAAVAGGLGSAIMNAIGPQGLQAPPRPDPAPGSLPRP